MARARGPLRRALAAIAERFVDGRGWEALGYARLRDYAAERPGVSTRSLYDLARVGGRLRDLPKVERALASGRLTWTKTRLLARVAKPEDEERWVGYARRVTARSLSREVRAMDRGCAEVGAAATDADPPERCQGVVIRCKSEVNGIWWTVRRLARQVAGEPLPVWACMELVAAEVLSAIPIEVPTGDPEPPRVLRSSEPPLDVSPELEPDAVPETHAPYFLEGLLEGLETADAFELDRRLRRAVALEQRLDAQVGPLLRAVADSRLYRTAFATLDAYARERLGMSPQRARALLRLERAGDHAPELVSAYRRGELSWVQALVLVPLFVEGEAWRHAAAWVSRATQFTVRRLEDDVERALELRETDPEIWAQTGGLPEELAARESAIQKRQTGANPSAPRETSQVFFSGPRDVMRLFKAVLCTVRRRMQRATEGEAFQAMLEHVIEAWSGGGRVRAAHKVFERDGWRCTVPGCSSRRNLQDHHIVFRSAGGSNALENRTTLCAWHHLRGVHAGIVRCSGRAPDGLTFELPLVRYGPGERIAARIDSPRRPTISSTSERVVQSGGASATHSQRERTMSPRSQARWVTAAG